MINNFVRATFLGVSIALAGCSADRTVVEYMAAANDLYSSGNLKGATIELKNALKKDSNYGEARILLGKVYLEMGDGRSALKEFEKAKEIEPTNNINPLIARAQLLAGEHNLVLELVEGNLSSADLNDLRVSKGMALLSLEKLPDALLQFDRVLSSDKDFNYARLGMARYHFTAGETDKAQSAVTDLLESDKNYAEAWGLLASINQSKGELASAEDAYSQAIELKSDSFDHILSRALIRIGLDKIEAAESDLNSLPRQMTEHPGVHYAKGLIHLRRQDFELAQTAFEKVLNTSGDYLPALFYSGVSHASLGQPQMAEDKLNRYVARINDFPPANHMLARMRFDSGDYENAETLLKEVIQQEDASDAIYGLLADTLMAQGKTQEARILLENLSKQRPESAQAKLLLAKLQLASGDQDAAVQSLEESLRIDSGYAESYAQLVSLHVSRGAVTKAVSVANRFIDVSDASISSHNLLATIYLSTGDDDNAKAAFGRALAMDSSDQSANGGMAAIALKNGEFEQAIDYYRAILSGSPGNLQALLNIADVNMARDDKTAARAAIEEAIDKNPQALEPRIRLGWFYAQSGDEDKVPELLSGFLRRYPNNVSLLVLLADSAYKTRNYSEAEKYLLRLRELVPDNAGIAYSLAKTHAAKKNNREYLDALGQVIGIDPNNVRARIELANYLVVLDKLSEAQKHVDYLNRSVANSAEVLLLKGKIAEKKGNFVAAVEAYAPIYNHTKSNLNLIRLTNAQWLSGQKSTAISSLERWLFDHPEDTVVQMELAARYIDSAKNDRAVSLYSEVLTRDSDNVLAMNNMAWLLKDSDSKRAVELAESAYKLQPRSVEIMDTLAQTLEARGAAEDLQRAKRLRERVEATRLDK